MESNVWLVASACLIGVLAGNFLGSTADRVVERAHCAVLVVR